MKQYTVREFRSHLKEALNNLPCEIIDGLTKQVLADLCVHGSKPKDQVDVWKSYAEELEQQLKSMPNINSSGGAISGEPIYEPKKILEGGKCENCGTISSLEEKETPVYDPATGEMKPVIKRICKRCIKNLNAVLNSS